MIEPARLTVKEKRNRESSTGAEVEYFRAVSPAEWQDLRDIARFRPGKNSCEFGKHFAASFEQALCFGEILYRNKAFEVVKIIVPKDFAVNVQEVVLGDGCGSGWFVEFPELSSITPVFLASGQVSV